LHLNKKQFGLIGGWFQHAYSSTLWKHPTYFDFNKGKICETTFFVDEGIIPNIKTKCDRKIAWILESSAIIPNIINDIINHSKEISESYNLIISHDKRIYGLGYKNFIYLPPHGYWIQQPQFYPKSKIVSMVSSAKRMCEGHNFRLNWVNKMNGKVDMFGRDLRTFDKKEEALCDYMFSITIENSQYETYWTEKILDCFCTGTIPIYHGAPDLNNHFNMDGILILNDKFDPLQLNKELYISKKDVIKDNFERALKFNIIEDIIYEKYLK
jgi:hypothetical protein